MGGGGEGGGIGELCRSKDYIADSHNDWASVSFAFDVS